MLRILIGESERDSSAVPKIKPSDTCIIFAAVKNISVNENYFSDQDKCPYAHGSWGFYQSINSSKSNLTSRNVGAFSSRYTPYAMGIKQWRNMRSYAKKH